jgi:hypothetical protein
MKTVGIEDGALAAFNSRLRHMLSQGLGPEEPPSPSGRGRRHEYSVLDTLNLALALQIQRAFVDPAVAATFILQERARLTSAWRQSAGTLKPFWLELELDAFAGIARGQAGAGRRGAIRIAEGRQPEIGVQPAPRLRIDLAAIVNRVGGALIFAGISSSAMAVALHQLRSS